MQHSRFKEIESQFQVLDLVFLFGSGFEFSCNEDSSRFFQWRAVSEKMRPTALGPIVDIQIKLWCFGHLSEKPLRFNGNWTGLHVVRRWHF